MLNKWANCDCVKAGVSMKTNDYVKYMTQTFVKYADQPKDERKRIRIEKNKQRLTSGTAGLGFSLISFILNLVKTKI